MRKMHSDDIGYVTQSDMVQEGRLLQDKVARREERNNLYAYLGREHFKPFLSKKKKFCNGISLRCIRAESGRM